MDKTIKQRRMLQCWNDSEVWHAAAQWHSEHSISEERCFTLGSAAASRVPATRKFTSSQKEAQQLETCFLTGKLEVWTSRHETNLPPVLMNGEESENDTSVYTQHKVTQTQNRIKQKPSSFTKEVLSSVTILTPECVLKDAFTSHLLWAVSNHY